MAKNLFPDDLKIPDIVELRNVDLTYDGGKTFVIKDLNLRIEAHQTENKMISILGASGCGKSSVLRFIAGLQKPSAGEIFLHEKLQTAKDTVGMIFQKYSSFEWLTVLDNVAFGLELQGVPRAEREAKAMEMIKIVGLEGHESKYAKMPTLSGGQLQRVAIARSLLANPSILLLDEPFSALDIYTRNSMQDLINDLFVKMKGITFILVTHNIEEAVYLGDEVWIMASKPGRIVNRIEVDLPAERTKALKRHPDFVSKVREIEDLMDKVIANV